MTTSVLHDSSNVIASPKRVVIRERTKLVYFRGVFKDCVRTHKTCSMDSGLQSKIQDLKVIDCNQRRVVPAPPDCKYFALSYVWGGNLQSYALDGGLPQTIEDSITAVLFFGYRYLWIDRFCIDQDGDHKHSQLQQMGAIYATAELTITAAAGDDPSYGLPGISSKCRETRDIFERSLAYSRWSSRGWTLQEDILSRRRLFFTEVSLKYSCGHSSRYANRPSPPHEEYSKHRLLAKSELVLSRYTKRQLTFDDDALNAVVGMFNIFHDRDSSWSHIWGAPYDFVKYEEDLRVYMVLDWSCFFVKRRLGYPSWSSLGWKFEYGAHISSILVNANDFQVHLWNKHDYEHIKNLARRRAHVHTGTDESKLIRLTAYSIEVDHEPQMLTNIKMGYSVLEPQILGTMHVTDSSSFARQSTCDQQFFLSAKPGSALAVFQSTTCGKGFILKLCGKHYERAGTFRVISLERPSQVATDWDSVSADECTVIFESMDSRVKKRTIVWG